MLWEGVWSKVFTVLSPRWMLFSLYFHLPNMPVTELWMKNWVSMKNELVAICMVCSCLCKLWVWLSGGLGGWGCFLETLSNTSCPGKNVQFYTDHYVILHNSAIVLLAVKFNGFGILSVRCWEFTLYFNINYFTFYEMGDHNFVVKPKPAPIETLDDLQPHIDIIYGQVA